MSDREYDVLRSSLVSACMEGFEVTDQTEQDCMRFIRGEISVTDLVKEIVARPRK